ncbi:helicase domino isoform X1 [Cephus cinctus]|uniref:Helicase domino isoform X1 n=1 Tax=Cephus cinctus TaxID=211228 RepID=A0AAJ7C0Q3_CEPCN|nr:helicase domino isoform X1 [Cephus cinctus]XP_015599062.1 helicase domino isoform X1 [Cephus cinctus]
MTDKQGVPNLPPLAGGGGNNEGSNGGATQQTVSLQQVLASAQGLNVLTTGGGQQFVITSQVPGLTQVIPSSVTTNAGIQQVGVTRIVNIGGSSPRVNVVGVAGSSGSPLTSPTRQNPTVVLATSPKLMRTSVGNLFVTPTSQASVQSPPARKRLRLSESTEKPTALDDTVGYRRRIMEHKMKRMRAIREKYAENASELFFLHNGGNMMDFQTWRKRSPTPQYLHFLRQHRLDPDDDDEDLTVPLPPISEIPTSPTTTIVSSTAPLSQGTEVKISGVGVTPVAVSTTLPAAVAQLSQQGGTPIVPDPPKSVPTSVPVSPVADKLPAASTSGKPPKPSSTPVNATTQPVVKLVKLPTSTVSSCDTQNLQEQIVEKAKQEAYVMQRITELQREGLWSERRLPKVQEPSRTKAHWDYLLEEMVWLAADFAQERKWKKAAAKKCARMVQKHFQEKAIQAQKAEKSQELRLKKIAGFVAKEIKNFWTNVEKLVEYKQQARLEEKRKKALDQHLNFIVGQTEKYSTWLTEGLNKTDGAQSVSASMNSSRISSPVPAGKHNSDDEFEPNQTSDDDEETIAKAEEEMKSNHKEEVELLKKESELPLEDLLKELPPNYLQERDKSLSPAPKETVEEENEKSVDGDAEFTVASEESSDDEDTIMEQEKMEGNDDHRQELDELKAENEMSIDELMAKYGNIPEAPMDIDGDMEGESGKESEKEEENEHDEQTESESESEDETKDEDSQTQSDDETGVGLKSLLEDLSNEKPTEDNKNTTVDQSDAHNEMDDVAALAESIQPKGNTLLTTSVVTKIPFLLKHSLREYQHIGLDWLVTMFDRKLNGILADEMGLGKTIQTIALLAHLACEKGNWGPHLIIVPTSVMLNWEMECKKWCPGFKILTYYGTQKERKQKRTGWTKPNAFHICITSYKLVIQDHQSFRRKKWKYLILDEAQNIKNFKSQRWQLLLNFQTQRRLLLTGTPLQNNLMELWSLMHFLMPNVFQSHREFKEWFSNPVTGMIEGNSEYNENIIRRLHKVLRPFLLRRLKTEVEKQLPKKYEHVLMCRLSKRQRFLYDDFMSRAKTKETLASGNLLSVINVLMQLRKVCNHPNLFEVRPTVSPFQMEAIEFVTASLAWSALDYDPFKHIDLSCLNLLLVDLELTLTAFVAHRIRRLQTPRKLIEEIDSLPDPPPRCPSGKIKINVRLSNQAKAPPVPPQQAQAKLKNLAGILPTPRVGTSPLIKSLNNQSTPGQGVTLRVAGGQQLQGYSVQLVQHQGSVKAIPVGTLAHNPQGTATVTPTTAAMNAQRITVGNANIRDGLPRLTTQTVTVKQGDSVQRIAVPSFAQLVQTSTGRHIILTSNQQNTNTVSFPVMTPSGQRVTVLSKSLMGLSTSVSSVNKVVGGVVTTVASAASGRPVMRVPPLNVTTSQAQSVATTQQPQQQQQLRCGIVTRNSQKDAEKCQTKEQPKSEFYIPQLEAERKQRRQAKLQTLANINERRCAACPLYGEDLFTALRIGRPAVGCRWHGGGWMHCTTAEGSTRTRKQFFSRTEALAEAIKSTELIVEELKEVFERFVVYVPAVRAPLPRFHVSHPPPHKLWAERRMHVQLQRQLSPKLALFHPVSSAMATQFPDPRLIQYDCGKLQSLDLLLRKLKTGNHRVLIFTQMTRMLDVLEAFLNFHGHIYLRLDGTTRVDQRQVLMERFNGDKRIFCFILSTRSGGVGVNLTGADTVIFYDSDWNPTMDAQAQDRCHRIGQTRDVHIYRLVSEKTVEENILKKANQKRLLGDLAIEGGNFTTAYFKSSTIQDLFNIDQSENDASTRMAEVLEQSKDREKMQHRDSLSGSNTSQVQPTEEKAAIGALENALAAVEEDLDVQAAKTAKAEAVADLAEFDENIPLDDADKEDTQISKAEQEVQNLVSQLTPIERYAMKFVEESEGTFSAAQIAAAERELEQQKKEWELDRLRALREEEERRMRMADDEEKPLTFGREDAQNQVNNASNSKKVVNKKAPPSRRSSRRRSSRSAQVSSESETETTTESESESQEDLVEDTPDEESSHTESQSQGDEDEEEEGDSQNESESGSYSKSRNQSNRSTESKNRLDLNSPRTRSRGNVKINLWTLDVSPILPGIRPKYTATAGGIPRKRGRPRADEIFALPLAPITNSKKPVNSSPANKADSQSSGNFKKYSGSQDTNSQLSNLGESSLPKSTQELKIASDKTGRGYNRASYKINETTHTRKDDASLSNLQSESSHATDRVSSCSSTLLSSKVKTVEETEIHENILTKEALNSPMVRLYDIMNSTDNFEYSNPNNIKLDTPSPKVKFKDKFKSVNEKRDGNYVSEIIRSDVSETDNEIKDVVRDKGDSDSISLEDGVSEKVGKKYSNTVTDKEQIRSTHRHSKLNDAKGDIDFVCDSQAQEDRFALLNIKSCVVSLDECETSEESVENLFTTKNDSKNKVDTESDSQDSQISSVMHQDALEDGERAEPEDSTVSGNATKEQPEESGNLSFIGSKHEKSRGISRIEKLSENNETRSFSPKTVTRRGRVSRGDLDLMDRSSKLELRTSSPLALPTKTRSRGKSSQLKESSVSLGTQDDASRRPAEKIVLDRRSKSKSPTLDPGPTEKVVKVEKLGRIPKLETSLETFNEAFEKLSKTLDLRDMKYSDESQGDRSTDSDTDFAVPSLPSPKTPNVVIAEPVRRTRRPDTPYPGVTTRSARATSNVEVNAENTDPEGKEFSNRILSNTPSPMDSKRSAKHSVSQFDGQLVAFDQGRITRSTSNRSSTPPPGISQKLNKSLFKRRPDTPLPGFLDSTTRPITRSHSNTSALPSIFLERSSTRSSKAPLDNGFAVPSQYIRKNKSISLSQKTSDAPEFPSPAPPRSTRKSCPGGISETKTSLLKRRPDTPMPVAEHPRVTRSGVDFALQSGMPFSPVSKSKDLRKSPVSLGSTTTTDPVLDTDSNGNAVGSDTYSKQGSRLSPILPDANDKPQRTAKVVAILTLDTLSNRHHNIRMSESRMNKKNLDNNTKKLQPENAKSKSAEASPKNSGLQSTNRVSSPLSARAFVPSNEPNNRSSNISRPGSKVGKTENVNNSKESSTAGDPTVIALIDLDAESDFPTPGTGKRMRKKGKRTRIAPLAKPLIQGNPGEIQLVDILDDDEEAEQTPPVKKSVRNQPPHPHPSEKLNSSPVS